MLQLIWLVLSTFCTQSIADIKFTEDGVFVQYVTMNIEDVKVGDLVYSYSTLTGELELCAVTATSALRSNHINYLTIVDEDGNEQTIETTDSHPFWVVTDDPDFTRAAREYADGFYHENLALGLYGYWVEAKDLREGDVFLDANGKLSTLTNIVRIEQAGGINVFNFTVEGNHNYFILAKEYGLGQTCVLVHNGVCSKITSSIKDHSALVKYAEKAGKSVQRELDHLVTQLLKGNMNPGKGTKYLFNGIYEARHKGARLYFRMVNDAIDIIAKSNKGDQTHVLNLLRKLYP